MSIDGGIRPISSCSVPNCVPVPGLCDQRLVAYTLAGSVRPTSELDDPGVAPQRALDLFDREQQGVGDGAHRVPARPIRLGLRDHALKLRRRLPGHAVARHGPRTIPSGDARIPERSGAAGHRRWFDRRSVHLRAGLALVDVGQADRRDRPMREPPCRLRTLGADAVLPSPVFVPIAKPRQRFNGRVIAQEASRQVVLMTSVSANDLSRFLSELRSRGVQTWHIGHHIPLCGATGRWKSHLERYPHATIRPKCLTAFGAYSEVDPQPRCARSRPSPRS